MNEIGVATAHEAAELATLRARMTAARQRIDAARLEQPEQTLEDQRATLRAAVESVRERLAVLEREHAAALAMIRADAETAVAEARAGALGGAGR